MATRKTTSTAAAEPATDTEATDTTDTASTSSTESSSTAEPTPTPAEVFAPESTSTDTPASADTPASTDTPASAEEPAEEPVPVDPVQALIGRVVEFTGHDDYGNPRRLVGVVRGEHEFYPGRLDVAVLPSDLQRSYAPGDLTVLGNS